MLKTLVIIQMLLFLVFSVTFANSATGQLDEKSELEFCASLQSKPNFPAIHKFSEATGHPIEELFLKTNCLNNSKIVEISNQKKAFPLTLIAGNLEMGMIFLDQFVKYVEIEDKLDDYKKILNRVDASGRTTLDVVEERIAAIIKEGTDRALLNMHGIVRAEMCYRGGKHAKEASAKICDNYPTKVYHWCKQTFSTDNLGLCLGYRGNIPEKLMMMLTGKCVKLIDDDEKLKACMKPLQYSDG